MSSYDRDDLESALKYLAGEYGLEILAGNISVTIRDFFDAVGHKGEVMLLGAMQRNDTLKNLVWLKETGKGSDECLRVMRLEVRKATEAFIREDAAVRFVNMLARVVGVGVSVEEQTPVQVSRPPVSDKEFLKMCEFGRPEDVEEAIRNGARVDAKRSDGSTALRLAARHGNTETVEILLKAGADVNAKDDSGSTALHEAVRFEYPEIVEVLLRYGANVNAKNIDKKTPLHEAANYDYSEIAEILLMHGADPNVKNSDGQTPLFMPASEGNTEIVSLLLKHGADVNSRDNFGTTALHLAAMWGHSETAEILLQHGANVNAKSEYGKTPLIDAAEEGDTETVELLLRYGADVNARDNFVGRTALASSANDEVSRILRAHGAR